jgi:hypothetical protein
LVDINKNNVIDKNNIVIICTNNNINKLYILYMTIFFYDTLLDKKNGMSYVCIDFEFYKNKIALMQISYNTNSEYNYIWINKPDIFTDKQKNIFINKILINNNTYKILHGSESNDLPYLYNNIITKKTDQIKFTRRLMDTRYLCEYAIYKTTQKKCSLYDSLLFFGTIDIKMYDYLNIIVKKNGPIQYIKWNINNLSNNEIYYALYDVLFLKKLHNDIHKYIYNNHSTLQFTQKYLTSIIRLVFLERMGISDIINSIKTIIDKSGVYIIKNTNMSINSMYIQICDNNINKFDVNYVYSVGYIKKYFSYILKYIIYSLTCIHYKIQIFCNKLCIIKLIEKLEKYECNKIIKLIKYIEQNIYFGK